MSATGGGRAVAVGRVAGKVALISGDLGGIGLAIAQRLGAEGARVVLSDAGTQGLDSALQALDNQGTPALYLAHEVRDEASWAAVLAQAVAHFGGLHILVNNAGIALPPPDGFEALELADWRRVMSVNLDGVFLGTREGVRAMKAQGGSIINIGSVAAFVGTPGGAAHGDSKGGVASPTRQAAVACARKGYKVRINAIHPCCIRTPLTERVAAARFGADQAVQALRDRHPFGCLGEPEDVAQAVLFLASDESRLVNAAELVMDGGWLSS